MEGGPVRVRKLVRLLRDKRVAIRNDVSVLFRKRKYLFDQNLLGTTSLSNLSSWYNRNIQEMVVIENGFELLLRILNVKHGSGEDKIIKIFFLNIKSISISIKNRSHYSTLLFFSTEFVTKQSVKSTVFSSIFLHSTFS